MRAILCIFLLSLACCNSRDKEKRGSVVQYEKKIVEVPDIVEGQTYKGQLVLKNTGDETLEIQSIKTDCACTVSETEKKKVLPNDSTIIHYSLSPRVQGRVQQTIYIENNSINESRILFLIRTKVII